MDIELFASSHAGQRGNNLMQLNASFGGDDQDRICINSASTTSSLQTP